MKKHFLFLLFSAFMVTLFAQKNEPLVVPDMPIDENTKLITFQERIDEKGTPQELYDRAMIWVKQYYKNTTEVIKSADREKAVIELRSSVKIFSTTKDGTKILKNVVYYHFKIECRQDRYRYTITNFNEKAEAASPIEFWLDQKHSRWQPACFEYLNQIKEQIQALIISLEEGMAPKAEIKDEW